MQLAQSAHSTNVDHSSASAFPKGGWENAGMPVIVRSTSARNAGSSTPPGVEAPVSDGRRGDSARGGGGGSGGAFDGGAGPPNHCIGDAFGPKSCKFGDRGS